MKKIIGMVGGAALLLAVTAGSVAADPVVRHEPGVDGAHPHFVLTGNGECVAIDSVFFIPADRGLHRGANESGNPLVGGHGPWHGVCP